MNDILSQVYARSAKVADLIDVCKRLPVPCALASLKADAEQTHATYPQYKGHFDGYVLCRVTRRVTTKMGVAFEKGDLAIMSRAETFRESSIPGISSITVYSNRNGIDTSVPRSYVEEVRS